MIVVCAGTRPEFIKMAPILQEMGKRGLEYIFVDTQQHHDWTMNGKFIEELGLEKPKHILIRKRNETECQMLFSIMEKLDNELNLNDDDIILVQGDTTSSLACALYASKNKIPLAHVEAGLRSYDDRMPEEYNRRLIDHMSQWCFAPTKVSKENLLRERVLGKTEVTGNTVMDALDMFLPKAKEPRFTERFILATFHRQENVDNPEVLKRFLDVCQGIPLPVIYPLHPRTARRIKENDLEISENIVLMGPLGYYDFLGLLKRCSLVLTDSGGIQEEVTHPKIRKKCVVMRRTTERPEAQSYGFTKVVGADNAEKIVNCIHRCLHEKTALPSISPYGNGSSSQRIIDLLLSAG